jgi:hypothetical protein
MMYWVMHSIWKASTENNLLQLALIHEHLKHFEQSDMIASWFDIFYKILPVYQMLHKIGITLHFISGKRYKS